jgi:hypothetical protein
MASALEMFPFTSGEIRAFHLGRAADDGAIKSGAPTGRPASLSTANSRAASSIYCKIDHLVGLSDCIRKARNRIVLVSSRATARSPTIFSRCLQVAHWFTTNKETTNERLPRCHRPKLLPAAHSEGASASPKIRAHSAAAQSGSTSIFELPLIRRYASRRCTTSAASPGKW